MNFYSELAHNQMEILGQHSLLPSRFIGTCNCQNQDLMNLQSAISTNITQKIEAQTHKKDDN